MKKDLTQMIVDYAAGVSSSEDVIRMEKRLLHDGVSSREEGAAAMREAVKAGKVLGEVEASTHNEAFQRMHEAVEAPALSDVLGGLKVGNGEEEMAPVPLAGEMLDMVSHALQNYLSPLLASAWKYGYMKGRMEEAENRERVPF